jgi:hypothetical protein
MAPRAAARLELLGFSGVMHYAAGKLDWMAAGLPTEGTNAALARAGTVARRDVPVCGPGDRVGDVKSPTGVAIVVDREGVVVGMLRADELAGDPAVRVEEAMLAGPSTFRPYVPIKEMADYMTRHDLESSPITTSDGKLVGVLFRADAVREAGG